MDWYSVYVEFRSPTGEAEGVTAEAIDAFMSLVEPYDGVVSGGPGHAAFDATVGMTATDISSAIDQGRELLVDAARRALLPEWPVAKLEVSREDVVDEELNRPQLPDLASGAEAAEILGVTRQRVYQLRRSHPQFPKPVYELGTGPLWIRSGLEAFARRWERVPGRHLQREAS